MGKSEKAVLKIDPVKVTNEITNFIRKIVKEANADGVVVGLSGGVDSSVVAELCVRALGKDSVLGILMPAEFTPKEDLEDAKELGRQLGIKTDLINIQEIVDSFFRALQCDRKNVKQKIPMANIHARARMVILYYYANLKNYLVAGTGDRSEALIGYFTKYGDGAADFLPIRHLYKTQVRKLAKHLEIPERIVRKPSSPQLYLDHKATDEIPLDYPRMDPVLAGLFDYGFPPMKVSQKTGVPIEVVEEVMRRFSASKHKREYPPMIHRL